MALQQSVEGRKTSFVPRQSLRPWCPGIPVWGGAMLGIAMVAVVVERFIAVASDLQLWGDGAWLFIEVVTKRGYHFWVGDWKSRLFQSRLFTILLEQTPTVVATHLRIHSLHLLSVIYGVTLYSHALLSLYLCYRYARRKWYILFPLLSFFAGPMNVETYLSTDSHLLVSLYWPVLFILLFREELTGWTLLLLLGLSVPMLIAYESMLFFGVILAGVCVWRLWRFPRQRALTWALAVWYLMGAAIAVVSILRPFDPSNRSGFVHGLEYLLQSPHLPGKISLLVLVCGTVVLAAPARIAVLRKTAGAIGLAGVAYLCFAVLTGSTPTSLDGEVAARVLNLLAPLVATGLLLLEAPGYLKAERKTIGLAALLVGGLGFGQAVWNLAAIGEWQGYLATLRYELLSHEGVVPYEESVLSRPQFGALELKGLGMNWSLPALSLYEAGRGEVRSIIAPDARSWFPFDPYNPGDLPDLSRYRIYYDSYRQTLERTWGYRLGETLVFQLGGSAIRYMRGDWYDPEAWAIWGGTDFGVDLPIAHDQLPDMATLWVQLAPNVSPQFPTVSVQVLVNQTPVTTWSLEGTAPGEVATRTVQIPKNVLELANPVRIRFRIVGPVRSPSEMGKGSDPRKLSVAMVKLRLEASN
jgi:hypothetical protein